MWLRRVDKYIHVIPAVIARFIAANQKNHHSARIECVQRAKRSPAMLGTQFAHMSNEQKSASVVIFSFRYL